jgi:hypothetical protein
MVKVVSEVYVAYVGNEYVEAAPTLAGLLAVLEEVCDADGAEDVCVWRGNRLVAVRVWDVATATERAQYRGADAAFTCMAFGPDGKTVVTGSGDTEVLIWDLTIPPPPPPRSGRNVITLH